jgi:hypothetical protein
LSLALRTHIESSKKIRLAILAAGILLSQIILYGPSLVGAKILLPLDLLAQANEYIPATAETRGIVPHDPIRTDLIDQLEPERHWVAEELRAGRWPAWNPGHYGGTPVLQAPWLSPLSILLAATPSPIVLAWYQLLTALVAGVGFYLFCRRTLAVGYWPAVIVAWIYPMSGYFVFWLGCPTVIPVGWLPWLLLAVEGTVRRPTVRAMLALAALVCAVQCTRQLDASAQVLLVAAAYGLWLLFATYGKPWVGPLARRAIVFALGGCLLGSALAAPYVLPQLEYVKEGDRAARRAAGTEERPPGSLSALSLMVLPDENGATRKGTYPLTAPFQIESLSVVYAGLVTTMFLAPLAWRSRRHRSFVIFSTALVYFSVGWCLNIGGIVLVLRLPILNLMSHNRLVFAASFAILAMSALGIESLGELPASRQRRWFLLPAMLLCALAVFWLYRAGHLPEPIATEIGKRWIAGEGRRWIGEAPGVAVVQTWFRTVYLAGGVLAVLAALGWSLVAILASWRWWLTAVLGTVVFLDMLWFAHDRSAQTDPALYYPRVPVLDQVAGRTTGRIIGVGCLPANVAIMAGLRDVRGYDGIDPARYVQLVLLAAPPSSARSPYSAIQWMAPKLEQVPPDRVKLSPVLDLLGVEYTIHRGSPPAGFSPPFVGPDYFALRNPSAMPRVFVPRRVEIVLDEKDRLARLGAADFDPRAVVYLESPVELPEAMEGRASVLHESPSEVTIAVTMATPGVVVLADRWDSGWRARLGDEPLPILIADHALRAVVVPQGTWTLKLTYEPAGFTLGMVLFVLAAAIIVGGVGIGLRRRHGRPLAAPSDAATPAESPGSHFEI